MRLGFVGTGNITTALVTGLSQGPEPPSIRVSPRNAAKATALAARFANVTVAPDNQSVVEDSEIVFLAVRPPVAPEVVAPLRFREDQTVVSLIATVPLARMRGMVAPATEVLRVCPLPCAAQRIGPILQHPEHPAVQTLLEPAGTVVAVSEEAQFEVLWAVTALIAPYYALMEEIAGWASSSGVPSDRAVSYTAAMFHGLAVLGADAARHGFGALVEEASTPGGLNEQALREIRAAGGYDAFLGALDSILTRLGGTAPPRS